jgi:hypothetical protein
MYLSASTTHLTAKTDSAATLHATAHYRDINHSTGAVTRGSKFTTVSSTEIAIAAAPSAGSTRIIDAITVAEAANAAELVAVSISTLSSTTYTATSRLIKVDLAAYQQLQYSLESGWVLLASDGQLVRQVAADA